MNRTAAHVALVRATRLALGNEPDLVLWPMNQGHMVDVSGRHYQTGSVSGFSDLFGILLLRRRWRIGRYFGLEAKTGNATLTKEQRLHCALVLRMGGFYAIFRSVDEAWAALERARRGEQQ